MIKPAAGQKWKNADSTYTITLSAQTDEKGWWQTDECGKSNPIHVSVLRDCYEFVPQTDLEWLAVNVEKWYKGAFLKKVTVPSGRYGWVLSNKPGTYTKKQWQQKRIELGLDKQIKEKEMINLSDAKVGDKYELSTGDLVELALIGDKNAVTKNCHGRYRAVKFNGDYGSGLSIVKKIDPNAWWKDLPPAEWFELYGTKFIAMDENLQWLAYIEKPEVSDESWSHNFDALELAIHSVNSVGWQDSLIKISDLKKWQEQNA